MTNPLPDLIEWAEKVGADEYGFYMVTGGARTVIPLNLTGVVPPELETALTPLPADPRPGSPNDPEG